MKKISKIISLLLVFCLLLPMNVFAQSKVEQIISKEIIPIDEQHYIEITITEAEMNPNTKASTKIKTGSKTVNYKNSNGSVLWYVKETGTFSYTGSSSKCINDTVSAGSNSGSWRITSKSSSRSGNTATGKATAKYYYDNNVIRTITETAKVSCSAKGTIS